MTARTRHRWLVKLCAASLLPETHSILEGHIQARPLVGVPATSVVHQDLAHEPRGHTKEMRAILPARASLF